MRITREDFKRYTDWQRFILGSEATIPPECKRPTLIAFSLALAIHGTLGLDCYASDTLLAREIGISRRHLAKYRRVAVALGWFKPNGKRGNRVEHLDISIPSLFTDVPELPELRPAVEVVEPRKPADIEDWDSEPWRDRVKVEPYSDDPPF
jgi:hypothetical protein